MGGYSSKSGRKRTGGSYQLNTRNGSGDLVIQAASIGQFDITLNDDGNMYIYRNGRLINYRYAGFSDNQQDGAFVIVRDAMEQYANGQLTTDGLFALADNIKAGTRASRNKLIENTKMSAGNIIATTARQLERLG